MKYVSYREIGIKACGLVAIIAMFLPFIHVKIIISYLCLICFLA